MDRGTWWATVHGVAESQKQLSDFHFRPFCSGSFSRKSPNRAQDSRKSVVRAQTQRALALRGTRGLRSPLCAGNWVLDPYPTLSLPRAHLF